jgi:hypothetical protein
MEREGGVAASSKTSFGLSASGRSEGSDYKDAYEPEVMERGSSTLYLSADLERLVKSADSLQLLPGKAPCLESL